MEGYSPPPRITSRQNPRVKDAVRLRSRRGRDEQGRFLVDGAREAQRALAAGIRCVEAFVCEELCDSGDAHQVVDALAKVGAELLYVSPSVYAKVSFGDRNDGVVVVAEAPRRSPSDLRLPAEPLVAVLEGIEKPGNVGAILRSADAAGVDAVVVADGRSDLFNPNTIRASLGTVFRDNVAEGTAAEVIAWLQEQRLRVFAARPDASLCYAEADLRGGVAIALGSEAEGLTTAWSGPDVTAVRLPMRGLADSLNVSTAAAVLFYEALRQRNG
jgi:TrmH family RNA methyltransferase